MKPLFLLFGRGDITGLVRIEWYYVGRCIDKAHFAEIAYRSDRGAIAQETPAHISYLARSHDLGVYHFGYGV